MILEGMTYSRKRLIEQQIKLWKGLREDYTRERDAVTPSTKEWHNANNIIIELNEKIKAAELAYRETR